MVSGTCTEKELRIEVCLMVFLLISFGGLGFLLPITSRSTDEISLLFESNLLYLSARYRKDREHVTFFVP